MLFNVLCFLVVLVVQGLSEAPPAPPQDIHVDKWLLTWNPATEEGDVTYTVQYSSFDSGVWTNVPACVCISSNSCDVISTKSKHEQGCILLRVRAERRGLRSTPVRACSRHGDSCTPDFSLTAGRGILTVQLSRNQSFAHEHAYKARFRVYYGKEGEPLKQYEDSVATVTIPGLQEGQRYCTEVQYLYYEDPVGLPTCSQCAVILESKKDYKQTEIIVAVVIILLCLIPVVAYFLIFQRGKIKELLQPPYHIPEDFFLEPLPAHHRPISTTEEHLDVITCISPECRD
ncbi:interferon gamma receptor 2 isoform X1 [Sebastes fasciatus]|uniref:interferon gamma receptor 2 isoform X1 n=1 Tax=Sebastes fasciatus TaxID=394691 RepID=UPI003D9DC08C